VLEPRLRLPHVGHDPLVRHVDTLEIVAVVVFVAVVVVARDVRVVLQREAVEGLLDLAPGGARRQPQRPVVVLLQPAGCPRRGRAAPYRRRPSAPDDDDDGTRSCSTAPPATVAMGSEGAERRGT
jgi:hypothetical protein